MLFVGEDEEKESRANWRRWLSHNPKINADQIDENSETQSIHKLHR